MSQSRRDFLKASGLVIMAGAAGYLGTEEFVRGQFVNYGGAHSGDASSRQRPTLVTIFLRGGADSLNAIVPYGDPLYYKYRTHIALRPDTAGKNGQKGIIKLAGSSLFGLNAGMQPLLPLIEQGQCVSIINVGSPDGTRSHFTAQDYMERGAPGNNAVTSGWLNRYLEKTKKPYDAPLRGLSAENLVPRALRGSYPVLAGNNRTEKMALFEDLYSPKNLVNMTARDGATEDKGSRLDDIADPKAPKQGLTSDMTRDVIAASGANSVERIKALDKAENTPTEASYPTGGLGNQLRTIAKVIKADVGLEVAQADYGSWDHHSAQGGAGGQHARMLGHLSQCIVAFHKDLGNRMDRVLVLVMSEFGRTVSDNGASGTDHGRAGFMLAMGGMLTSKDPIVGTWKGMQDLDSGRFLPVHTDFRAVMAESISRLFHVDPFKTNIFPGYQAGERNFLNIMKQLPASA